MAGQFRHGSPHCFTRRLLCRLSYTGQGQRYNCPGNSTNGALSVAISPDGKTVFITGGSPGAASGEDYATIAYRG